MDLSGIIFVVLAIAWAAYLIPKALKHGDEVAGTRPADSSAAGRVLARREPVSRGESRLVVPAPSTVASAPVPAAASVTAASPAVASHVGKRRAAAPRTAAKVAARRRRRVLLVLLVAVAAVAAFCALGRLPWVSLAAPVAATAMFLLLCRTQVRRDARRPVAVRRAAPVEDHVVDAPAPHAAHVEELPVEDLPVDQHGVVDLDLAEDTFGIPVAQLQAALAEPTVEAAAQHGGGLWDPLPVTLPTYVTKPKARRTVRTIDLGEPGTWTSGHTAEHTEIAAEASETPDVRTAADDSKRAVGS